MVRNRHEWYYKTLFLSLFKIKFFFSEKCFLVDFDKRQLCWTDGGTQRTMTKLEIKPKIECINMDGSNRKPIVELRAGSKPYGISLSDKQVFWTDWNR